MISTIFCSSQSRYRNSERTRCRVVRADQFVSAFHTDVSHYSPSEDFYFDTPANVVEMESRLQPARLLVDAGLPVLVHGDDALALCHFVPVVLNALHICVPDVSVERCASIITRNMDYHPAEIPEPWKMSIRYGSSLGSLSPFPRSAYLELGNANPCVDVFWPENWHPQHIFIHPGAALHMNILDNSSSMSGSPPLLAHNERIRFPTLGAMLNSCVDTLLDPPEGYRNFALGRFTLAWIDDLQLSRSQIPRRGGKAFNTREPSRWACQTGEPEIFRGSIV